MNVIAEKIEISTLDTGILYSVKNQILSIGYEHCSRFFPSFIS